MRRFSRSISPVRSGFSLLELSIVIAIISIMAVMGLEMAAAFLSNTAYQNTQTTASTVDAALVKFRAVYGRLPCPAELDLPVTDPNYGKENCTTVSAAAFDGTIAQLPGGIAYIAVPTGGTGTGYSDGGTGSGTFAVTIADSTTASAKDAAATAHIDGNGVIQYVTIDNPGYGYKSGDTITVGFTAGGGTGGTATAMVSSILVGALPVRDLNLPLADEIDGFSGKFFYYVTKDLTSTANFANEEGVIQVRSGPLDEAGVQQPPYPGPSYACTSATCVVSDGAAYTIISTGRDQRGAYSRRGALENDCVMTSNFNVAIDAQNCFFEGSSVAPNLTPAQPLGVIYNSPFNNGITYSNYTDDIVVVRMKSDL